jgi:hypothetical protein
VVLQPILQHSVLIAVENRLQRDKRKQTAIPASARIFSSQIYCRRMPTQSIPDLARVVDQRLKRDGAPSPGRKALTKLLEIVYFTSLKTEEGRSLQVRIALVDPANADPSPPPHPRAPRWEITKLSNSLPCTVSNLVKLSKAADPWSSCLAVYLDSQNEFYVWGLIDQTVHFNTRLVRESSGGYAPPGLFHVVANGTADLSVHREYGFVARLQQDRILKRRNDVFWSGPVSERLDEGITQYIDIVHGELGQPGRVFFSWYPATLADTWISALCRVLISIQRYRHGGALLITTSECDLDIKYRISYGRLPRALINLGVNRFRSIQTYQEIEEEYMDKDLDQMPIGLYLDETVAESECEDYEQEITGCVRFISSLSCVDGLILATPDLAISGFGVEIRIDKEQEVDAVYLSSSPKAPEKSLRRIEPTHYGMRHRSMMRYCYSHPKSIGFVVSQDGEIRAITRVNDKLVMWENLSVLSFFEPERKRQIAEKKES